MSEITIPVPALYYIENRKMVGNCAMFWRENGSGYTCDLDNAWRVTLEKARNVCRDRPMEDFPRPCAEVEAASTRHVSVDFTRSLVNPLEMTTRQKELARHALGLPNSKRCSYRNRFCCSGTNPGWAEMVENGFAKWEASEPGQRHGTFAMTQRGALLALKKGEWLDQEDFPDV